MKRSCTYAIIFVILCSAVPGCQRDGGEPLPEKKQTIGTDTRPRAAELLDAMNMYRFTTVQEAPAFELPAVSGEKVSLQQFRGKVVLLSFWATW